MAGRKRRRRFGLAAALALALSVLGAGVAHAALPIVASDDVFAPPLSFPSNQGEVVPFQNTGSNQHNVTASAIGPDGKPLFRSSTIGTGTDPVQGTQYLTTGSYSFTCTIHPNMTGTLVVGASGSPQARPSSTLRITNKTISSVVKSGILVQVTNTQKIGQGINITAKLGKTTLGSLTNLAEAQGVVFEKITLTKAAKKKLKKKKKATITVTSEVPFAAPATTKAKLK